MTTAERFDVAKVSRLLGTERAVLVALGGHAHRMYRSVRIAEDSKVRVLDIPNERLKACQRALLDRVLQRIPVSESVFSVSGKGVIPSALRRHGYPGAGTSTPPRRQPRRSFPSHLALTPPEVGAGPAVVFRRPDRAPSEQTPDRRRSCAPPPGRILGAAIRKPDRHREPDTIAGMRRLL